MRRALYFITMILVDLLVGSAQAEPPSLKYVDTISDKNFRKLRQDKAYVMVESEGYTRLALAKMAENLDGIDDGNIVSVNMLGRVNVFRKGPDKQNLFLLEVDPGRYAVYGLLISYEGGGVGGVCACMGSISFTAKAGRVVVLGRLESIFIDALNGKLYGEIPDIFLSLPDGTTGIHLIRKEISDSRILPQQVIIPTFSPIQYLPNWYGLFVDRLMPIEGVFRYEQDRQIDLTQSPAKSN